MNSYTPPPPHAVPKEAAAYVGQMDSRTRRLHEMAQKLLGSSYFVEFSHGFQKWKAAQAGQK